MAESLHPDYPSLLGIPWNMQSDHRGRLPTVLHLLQPLLTSSIIKAPSFFELAQNYQVTFTELAYTINGPLVAYGIGV